MIAPRYLNLSTVSIVSLPILNIVSVAVSEHIIFVFATLISNLTAHDSSASLFSFYCGWVAVCATSARSSANSSPSIVLKDLSWSPRSLSNALFRTLFRVTINSSGERGHPCLAPQVKLIGSLSYLCTTFDVAPEYNAFVTAISFGGTIDSSRAVSKVVVKKYPIVAWFSHLQIFYRMTFLPWPFIKFYYYDMNILSNNPP